MKTWTLALAITGATLFGSVTCDEAKTAFDCHEVCTRYQSCFDNNYDVSACRDRCRSKAANDNSVQDQASRCASCIDDKSCAGALFGCATECVGIVP
jgi:hypothetical protein